MADHRQTDDIDARIAAARAADASRAGGRTAGAVKGYGQGSRVLAELIGAPLGGGLIGWLLDRWLSTGPWLMLVLLVLSIAVAFRNIYRIGQERPE